MLSWLLRTRGRRDESERGREGDRQTDRERQSDRQTDRQTDRQAGRNKVDFQLSETISKHIYKNKRI